MNKWNPERLNISPSPSPHQSPPFVDPDSQSRSSIQLSKYTRKKLIEFGNKGDTYDGILNRLMDDSKQLERAQKDLQELINKIAGYCYCHNCSAKFFVSESQSDRPVCPECMTTLDVELVGGF